ncbi:MAG: deoxyribose-phosphate aldolase [Acidobacteria bacterium]|nr:MAG: deoxyribose-phosphate aldolase [Acidobacteriota bacterium]PIE89167.1 MAG: deoxyribose-phosphate aldolase [Acidobacteriota bacterium]
MTAEQIAKKMDHTLLKPEATTKDIEKLCHEAIEYGFFSVCVNPTYVKQAFELLKDSEVAVCCVVGFPLGASVPEVKAVEARQAILNGASEIDMVVNVGALKSDNEELVYRDVRTVVEACRKGKALLKVILETCLLNEAEIVRLCEICMRAGADFVKTSTGFGSAGAKEEHVRLMAKTVEEQELGVKASGGVRTYDDVVRMIQAGATRIGASSGVHIVEQARKRQG